MDKTEEQLRELGIEIPEFPPPIAKGYAPVFTEFVVSEGMLFVSGRLAKRGTELLIGSVGGSISLEEAKTAAREIGLEFLATLKQAAGQLDHVDRVLKLSVMVKGVPGFRDPHRVADGVSELMVQALGERGMHARSSMVVADLPFGCCVEVDMIARISNQGQH